MIALIRFCLHRPVTTLMVHLSLITLGLIALTRLPLNSMPESERPVISVRVDYPNASPQQVEREITKPIEEVLATMSGISSIDSESEFGESSVRLRFDWGANLAQIKVEVRERLARIKSELPIDDIDRIRISGAWNSGDEIIKGRISSRGIDLSENYELLVNRVRRPLERIEGVSQVVLEGVVQREIQVDFRRAVLEQYNLSLGDVVRRLREHNTNVTVGDTIDDGQVRSLRVVGGFESVDDVKAFLVDERGLRLDQIAKVELKEGELRFGRHLNGSFAVSIEVFKESTANTVETCERVKRAIQNMEQDPLLSGIELLVWEDQGAEILNSLEGLRNTGFVGSLLALGILFIFLRRFSATLLVGLAIPLSVLTALAWLYLLGRELNIITIVALMLGVGMLADTAVVVVEAIVRLSRQGLSAREAAEEGACEVASPIFAATLTSVIVFIPVAFGPQSQMTDYLKELGAVISLTLGSSLFVSLTLIPMVSARIYSSQERADTGWFMRVRSLYERVLRAVIHEPIGRLAAFLIIPLSLLSLAIPLSRGFQFDLDDTTEITKNVSVFYRTEGSVDFRTMEEYVDRVEQELFPSLEKLGISDVYSWYKDNFAWTALYPERPLAPDELALVTQRVDDLLPKIPGVDVRTGSWGMFWGRRNRSAGMRTVRVNGESVDQIQQIIEDLRVTFLATPGVRNAEVRHRDSIDEIRVSPDSEVLDYLGVSSTDFSDRVSAHLTGGRVREVRTYEGDTQINLRLEEEDRDSIDELTQLKVASEGGGELRLEEISAIEIAQGAGELRRENRQSTGTLSVQFENEALARANSNLAGVLEHDEWQRGYDYELGSGWRQRQQNTAQFTETLLLAIFLVFIVMACQFESLFQPVVLLFTVLLAIPGVIWFLYWGGEKLDQPAAIGVVFLPGIVVYNRVVMIDHMNRYRRRGLGAAEAVIQGGLERLRPILITALTTVIGLIPLGYSSEIARGLAALGLEVGAPLGAQAAGMYYFTLAHSIIGGLTASTVLTLILLPLLAFWIFKLSDWLGSLWRGPADLPKV